MFRLVIAICIAVLLMPVDPDGVQLQETSTSDATTSQEVSSLDVLSAAQSIYSDVSTFCHRNEETCETAKAFAKKSIVVLASFISDLKSNSAHGGKPEPAVAVDRVTTASVK